MSDERFDKTVTTTCGYCGVGCRLEAHARSGRVASISPAADGPANRGHTCLKGRFAHQFSRSRERLSTPLIREDGELRAASWDEALGLIARELGRIRSEHGPDAIAGLASSRATNEDCWAMQRLMRAAIGTNNIDNCSRVCHSPTSYALRASLGYSGATGTFADIDAAGAAIIIGANPTEGHPVVGARIKQAALRGLRLVTIDPRRIELADHAVVHLAPRPGTNAAVVLGLAHVAHRDGFADRAFIAARTDGIEAFEDLLAGYDPAGVEEISGVPAADLERAAHVYAEAGEASLIWGLGVTEHKYGSEVVQLLCSLALMTGKVGRAGSALLPLRGQNNVQGSSDMGALPDTYSGYRRVDDEQVAQAFEARWGVPLSRAPGLKIPQMFDAAVAGTLKAMYIFGEDVAQTDPNTTHVIHALESLEFVVCQDIFETETTRYADVVLPASSFLEKTGTFTNAERRIQRVDAAIEPPGDARTDFDILLALSRALGHDMGLADPEDAMREIAALTPEFAGVTYERLGRRGLLWPVAADGTDVPILYEHEFHRPGGRAHIAALPYKEPGDAADEDFPLVLVTGRRLQHYNAGTMTRRTANLELMDRDWLEIHPDDAARLWIGEGDLVSVRSRVGRIEIEARVTERIEPGHVFTAFHFPEVRTNLLIGASADVNTSCPEYKVVAVDVRPVAEQPSHTPALAGAAVLSAGMDDAALARMIATVARDGGASDEVAIEEPLEIRVDGAPLAVTMRTPGHDEELALGFLVGEGLIDRVHAAGPTTDLANNVVEVTGPLLREVSTRRFYTSSSCGVCGKGALEEVAVHAAPATPGPLVARALLAGLPRQLLAAQPGFARTGGLHATGLFSAGGVLVAAREDVGRHNAMDKVIGRALLDGLIPLADSILCVSGRLSFELVQKAAVAGCPILVGVGAPSSLAIALAAAQEMTLCGFARGDALNVYAGEQRVA